MKRNGTGLYTRWSATEMPLISNEHGCIKRFAFVSGGKEVTVLLLQKSKNKRKWAALKIPAFLDVTPCKLVTNYQSLWCNIPKDFSLQWNKIFLNDWWHVLAGMEICKSFVQLFFFRFVHLHHTRMQHTYSYLPFFFLFFFAFLLYQLFGPFHFLFCIQCFFGIWNNQ